MLFGPETSIPLFSVDSVVIDYMDVACDRTGRRSEIESSIIESRVPPCIPTLRFRVRTFRFRIQG
jgi:hypothetical protein